MKMFENYNLYRVDWRVTSFAQILIIWMISVRLSILVKLLVRLRCSLEILVQPHLGDSKILTHLTMSANYLTAVRQWSLLGRQKV